MSLAGFMYWKTGFENTGMITDKAEFYVKLHRHI